MSNHPAVLALLAVAWVAALWLIYRAIGRLQLSTRTRDRAPQGDTQAASPSASERQLGFLGRWLALAGFQSRRASTSFLIATAVCGLVGVLAAWAIEASGLAGTMVSLLAKLPGGVGDLFVPIAWSAPWLLLLLLVLVPWLFVRHARRARVQFVEQDLPATLDLLSTLSEAGLGFDAAIAHILETRLGLRPLASELRAYQADQLVGRPRVQCLRRLAARLEVPSMSIVVSALVQSEQLGTGIASVLRLQADDLRARRREQANAAAQTLPVKRMFPLVTCFLPGLFVWTLGPAFVQLFKVADAFIQIRDF